MAIFVLCLTWYWQAGDHKAGNSLLLYADYEFLHITMKKVEIKNFQVNWIGIKHTNINKTCHLTFAFWTLFDYLMFDIFYFRVNVSILDIKDYSGIWERVCTDRGHGYRGQDALRVHSLFFSCSLRSPCTRLQHCKQLSRQQSHRCYVVNGITFRTPLV